MVAVNVYVPSRSPNCLLPLQEALQDQQGGLNQDPFKWLPLHWDLECMRFCVHPLRAESVPYTPLALPYASPACLQRQMFWGPIFLVQDPQAGQPYVGLRVLTSWIKPLQLWLSSCLWVTFQLCDHTVSPPLLPVMLWFFLCIFSCERSFLLVFRLFS